MTDEIWTYVESSEEPTPTEIEADIVRIRQNIRKAERPAEMEGEEPHIIWTYGIEMDTSQNGSSVSTIRTPDGPVGQYPELSIGSISTRWFLPCRATENQ